MCKIQGDVSSILGVVIGFLLFFFALDTQAQGICDRTSTVQTEILNRIEVSGLTCGAVTPAQLSSINRLDLSRKGITSLDEDDFDGLSALARLDLNDNSLTTLPGNIFDGLSKLQNLYLDYNDLTALPGNLFDGLSSLEVLNLRNNKLTSLPGNLFDGLSNLNDLNLRVNLLTGLPVGIFGDLSSLDKLRIDHNRFTSLHQDLFEDLSSLISLNLSVNTLTSLHQDLFDGLSTLEDLHLDYNDLISLHEDLFDDLPNLKHLFIGGNDLSSLHEDLFDGLSKLENLHIDYTDLSSLHEDLFDGLSELYNLNLSNNLLLNVLPENIFNDSEPGLLVSLFDTPIYCLPQTIVDLVDRGAITVASHKKFVPCTTPKVSLVLTPDQISENGGRTRVTATMSPATGAKTTIELSVDPETNDYTFDSRTLTIPRGATTSTKPVTITAVDNEVDAPDKTFLVGGTAQNNLREVIDPDAVKLTIIDDDEVTGITLEVTPSEVNEDGGRTDVTVTATLDAARGTDTEVTVTVGRGTAVAGTDYSEVSPFGITISANQISETGTFAFTPTPDNIDEPNETVLVTGLVDGLNVTGTTLTIIDTNPSPKVTLVLTPATIVETDGLATVTATLNAKSSATTTVEVSVDPNRPAMTSDYVMSSNTTLTIAAGATTSTGTVTITAVGNEVDAPNRTFRVGGTAQNTQGVTDPPDVTLTITDDDVAKGITLEVTPSEVTEDAGSTDMMVTATLDVARDTDIEVTVKVGEGTAAEESDFSSVDQFTLTIASGEQSSTGVFTLTPTPDTLDESDETILVTGYTSISGLTVTGDEIMILDDDDPLSLSIRDLTVQEDAGVARAQIDVTPAAPTELSVTYRTTPQTASEGLDYTSSHGTLEIPAGSTTAVIEVPIIDDLFMESTETFLVRLSDLADAVLDQSEATVTIEDNDVYRLQVLDASASESASRLTFTVTLDTPHLAQDVRVDYETEDMTATATDDYTPQRGTLVFPKGEVRLEVSVPIIDDTVEELNEIFLLRLSEPEHALLSNAVATGTIRDDDLPAVSIVSLLTVREDVGTARFAVTRSLAAPGRDTEVSFTVTSQSAEAPLDYQVLTSGPLRFTSGQTTEFIEVKIIDDKILEGDETFSVELTGAQYGVLEQSEALGTIVDNEDPVTVSIQDVEVIESTAAAVFPVTLSGLVSTPRTFTYTTADETAEAGDDYESVTGTVTFAAGALRQEIRVPILDDLENESTETFLVRLSGTGILDGEGQGTIQDDDVPLTVSIYDGSASEDAGSLMLPVRLNRASSRVVTVQFASSDETANASSDYGASRGIVIFEQGTTEGLVVVQVVDDADAEPEETFQVTLSNARHAAIVRGVGTGTIVDNEGSTAVSVQGVTMSRRAATFEVKLSMPSPLPVTVGYASEDGTAKAGQDYEPRVGQITFAPGEVSKTVDVKILSNEPAWQAKTFSLVLLSAVNAELHQVRKEAVMEEEIEENVLDAYVSRVLRTWASHVVEALTRRTEGLSQCRVPELSWLRYGTRRPSPGELFAGCGAMFTQVGWSAWGQGAFTRLRGMDGALSLRSDITTMLVGVDHTWSRGWMVGVMAAHSLGSGSYDVAAKSGTASSRLTGVYPYVSYQTGAGMRAWLLVGPGHGTAEVDALESDLGAGIVALGLTGTLVSGTTGRLGYEADAFWAAAEVEAGSNLGMRRLRAGVEGSLRWGPGVQPYVEAALRHDSGDAETGLGLELGGGVRWSASRLRLEVGSRTLAVHSAEGMQEWGLMATVAYGDPSGLGPTMQVRPMWGSVYGGDLWREEPIQYAGQSIPDQRMEVEVGYGTRLYRSESLGRSIAGMTLDQRGRAYRIGYNLRMTQGLQLSVTARAMDTQQAPRAYGLNARMDLQW